MSVWFVYRRYRDSCAVGQDRTVLFHLNISRHPHDFKGYEPGEFFVMVLPPPIDRILDRFIEAVWRKTGDREDMIHVLIDWHDLILSR